MFKIKFYRDKQGNEPITDYIRELNAKATTDKNKRIKLKKIVEYMKILENYGTRAGIPYMKHIEADIWELRPIDDRLFFAYWKDNTFVILHMFVKKTNKTPQREINQAKQNLKEFLERMKENE